MFCGKCGAKNPDNAAFCGNCGAPLAQTAPEQRNTAPVQPPAAPPPAGNAGRRPKRIGAVPVVIAVLALIFIVRGFGGKEAPPADDSPAPSAQDPVVPDGGGSQEGGTTGGSSGGEGTGTGGESSSTPSGLTGTPDESGVIQIELTDMGEYDAVVLTDADWDNLDDLSKTVSYVSNGATYYLGTDRLAPLDLDEDRNLIMQIPNHWVHIAGMTPYLTYIGDYSGDPGEYLVYALVNGNGAFLSVVTDWSSFINLQGYYLGDLSTGEYDDTLCEFYSADQVSLGLMTSDGLFATEPYAPGDLSVEYRPINTSNFSEISVQYRMTDSQGQQYCTPYMTWK